MYCVFPCACSTKWRDFHGVLGYIRSVPRQTSDIQAANYSMDAQEINSLVDSRVREFIKEAHRDLLKDIGVMFNKISAPVTTSSASVSVVDAPKFKRRSNEEQFRDNSKVITKLEQAESSIECEMVSQVKENIIEGRVIYFSFNL